jgi:hypothetical protein
MTSRIGVTSAAAASSIVASRLAHEYPGEAGSRASKPVGRCDGAIARHGTATLTYVAPAERESSNAVERCELLNRAGSTTAVTSGAVPGVEYDAAARPATPAEAVTAARHRIAAPVAR